MQTIDQLTVDLRRLGVERGDVVMVHASLRRIGPVDGGAAGVLDAIDAAIGREGTMFMTLGAHDDWGWVNEHPEEARAALLHDAEPFDVLLTPADPDNGVLIEPGDRAALERAIVALARDPQRRREIGRRNRAKAEAELDVAHFAATLGRVYERVLGAPA